MEKTRLRDEISVPRLLTMETEITVTVIESLLVGGFPNPAEVHFRPAIEINEILKLHPTCTYVGTAWSDSMENLIFEGAALLIDTSREIRNGNIVAAKYDGNWLMKRFWKDPDGTVTLHSENPAYPPLTVCEGLPFSVFGRITRFVQDV